MAGCGGSGAGARDRPPSEAWVAELGETGAMPLAPASVPRGLTPRSEAVPMGPFGAGGDVADPG
jgi:hypothetical protein